MTILIRWERTAPDARASRASGGSPRGGSRTAGEYCGVVSPGEATAAALATIVERAAAPVPVRREEERICRVLLLLAEAAASCCPLTLALRHASPRVFAVAAGLFGARELGLLACGAATQKTSADAMAAP